jgi:hypothetical protein
MPTPEITYKLPRPFMDACGGVLGLIDWTTQSTAKINLPNGEVVTIEAVKGRYGAIVIRAATPGSAVRIRRLSEQMAAENPEKYPGPVTTEAERILSMRNPPPDKQD